MKERNVNFIITLRPLKSLKNLLSFHATKMFSVFKKNHHFEKLYWTYPVSTSYEFLGLHQLCKLLGDFLSILCWQTSTSKYRYIAPLGESFPIKYHTLLRFMLKANILKGICVLNTFLWKTVLDYQNCDSF